MRLVWLATAVVGRRVVRVVPRTMFATEPPMWECSVGLIDALKTSLMMSSDYSNEKVIERIKQSLTRDILARAQIATQKRLQNTTPPTEKRLQTISNTTKDDLKLDAFMKSSLIQSIIGLLISNITIEPGMVSTVHLGSPMINMGQVLCAGAGLSFLLDTSRDRDPLYTCTLMTLVGLMTCHNAMTPSCPQDVGSYHLNKFPRCSYGPQGESQDDINLARLENDLKYSTLQGYLDYWLFQAIDEAGRFTRLGWCKGPSNSVIDQIIPGWTVDQEIWYAPEGSALLTPNSSFIPLTLVATQNSDPCQILIVTRGSSTDYEWAKDFEVTSVPGPSDFTLNHRGMVSLSAAIYPQLQDYLVDYDRCPLQNLTITVTGHSMGGGVSQVLAAMLLERFPAAVNLVTFAALHALDLKSSLSILANARMVRNWVSEFDPVPYLPCATATGLPRCNSRINAVAHGYGRDAYSVYPNVMDIPRDYLTSHFDNKGFGEMTFGSVKFSLLNGEMELDDFQLAAPLAVAAYHTCAYSCFLDSKFCGTKRVTSRTCWYCGSS